MKNHGYFKTPQHGLQIEETLTMGDKEGVEHLARYWHAFHVGRLLSSKRVVDLGCGGGYGSRILLEIPDVKQVIGFDADKKALNTARGDYADARLSFEEFWLENEWSGNAELSKNADLVVCYECMEMLKHREFFLEQAVKIVASDGAMLLSANFVGRQQCHAEPNDAYFHYTRPVLERLLQRYFRKIEFGCDGPSASSLIWKTKLHIDNQIKERTTKGEPWAVCLNTIFLADPIR